jgi:hypothetical protein
MKRLQNATSRPHGHLVVDLESCTPEQDRLRELVFQTESPANKKNPTDEEAYFGEGNSTVTPMNDTDDDDDDNDDDDNADDNNNDVEMNDKDRVEVGVKRQSLFQGPPGKRIKEQLKKERKLYSI